MSYQVEVDYSPTYEMVCSFMIFCKKKWTKHLELGSDWIKRVEQQLDPEFLTAVVQIKNTQVLDYFYLLAWKSPEKVSTRSFLKWVNELSEPELYEILHPYVGIMAQEWYEQVGNFTGLLKTWYERYFKLLDKETMMSLHHDYQLKNVLLPKMEPQKLIELATSGVILEPVDELHTVVLVPSVHFRPLNHYNNYIGVTIMHYALDTQQEEDDEKSPPVELMRMTRALADPSRVQLLKLITQAPKSFTEVVNISNLSKGTVHHHMMMLRAAGLIRIHIHGNQERFSYRREGILDLKGFLEFYLG